MAIFLKFISSGFTIICFLKYFENNAYAYLDPGAGSMMVQVVLAGIAAVSVSIGIFWKRVKLFLRRIFGWKQKDDKN